MLCSIGEITEEWFIRRVGYRVAYVCYCLVCYIFTEMISLGTGFERINKFIAANKLREKLVCASAQETIKFVEAAAERPFVERSCWSAEIVVNKMPFAERKSVINRFQQELH